MINLALVTQSFKVDVIKPLLKKPTLHSGVLINYRLISNLPFLSKVYEKAVDNQLCDFLHNNSLRIFSQDLDRIIAQRQHSRKLQMTS